MTGSDDRPDFADLVRSPYDPEPEHRSQDQEPIPWVAPVVAAVLGALLVGIYVIYAIVQGPGPEETPVASTTVAVAPETAESDSVPDGFTPVTEAVGASVEAFDVSSRGTITAIATAVAGGEDPGDVAPLDPAYWVLRTGGAETPMRSQYEQSGALGNITVEFQPFAELRDAAVIPYLAEDVVTEVITVDLDATVPQVFSGVTFELEAGASVTIDELTIGDGWGWLSWSMAGGDVAKVDAIVTFVGTDDPSTPDDIDPTRLTPAHLQPLTQGSGSIPLPPMFGFDGSAQLVRSGEPLTAANQPTAILVEFTVTTPVSVSRGPAIELGPGR